ncbi:MAG: FtsW/RodA/SpoVE family cell cycle protein [Eggerthellaceae bacterium]|nr:FtsW/RodA/SpoVE family cell cycle protein [Eggerthellaceae bacterium]
MANRKKTPYTPPAKIVLPRHIFALCVFALILFGLVMVYSASSVLALSESGDSTHYMRNQLISIALGGIIAFVVARFIPTRLYRNRMFLIAVWLLIMGFLLLVRFAGTEINGAVRWIYIGSFGFQPSELAKIAFALIALKICFDKRNGEISTNQALIRLALLVLLPLIICITWWESDLGTTLVVIAGLVFAMYFAEFPWPMILAMVGVIAVFGVIFIATSEYRMQRFIVWIDPWNDGSNGYGAGYNSIRSYFAFAEGGLFGVGLGNSHEKYMYLFAPFSDFIFSTIGEELGFVGAISVVILFIVLLWQGTRIAKVAKTDYASALAATMTYMLVFQAFINMASACGVIPVTGKPLPFISAGGTSMITSLIIVGLIMAVSWEAGLPDEHEQRRDDLRVIRVESQSDDRDVYPEPDRQTRRRRNDDYSYFDVDDYRKRR